jgi:glycosyltransferase involved in cell wall biosynthesis
MSALGPDDVSVVIPALEDEPYLEAAIESARAEGAGEILVLATAAGRSAQVARASGARLIEPLGLDPPNRRNQGAKEATLAAVAFLDADDLFTPGRLSAMAALLGDGVTGLMRAFASPGEEEVGDRLRVDPTPRRGMVVGTLIVRRSSFFAIGGFREDILTGEIVDWLDRAGREGMDLRELDRVVLERRIHGGAHHSRERHEELHASYLRLARERIVRRREA